MHHGVREGNENLCKLLLENNAKVNIQDESGYTPLHWCVMRDSESLCRLLLEHNADVNIQDKGGQTPLHQSVTKSDRYWYRARDCSQITDLLIKYGVQDIDVRDAKGRTPLQLAVRSRNDQAVQKLLDLGADVSEVKADESGAMLLEPLKYEAEMRERHLKFDPIFGPIFVQETTETEAGTSGTSTGAEKLTESRFKSKKMLRQTPSHTTEKTEDKPKAEPAETEAGTSGTSTGAEKLTESHFKSKKMLRQTPSHTTEKTEDKPKAEPAKTMVASHSKSMASSSSRTN